MLNFLPSELALQAAHLSGQELLEKCPECTRADHRDQPTFGSDEGVLNVTKSPANYEAFRGVAVDVFKTQNLAAIRPLKNFLTALPSPSYIRRVLLEAVYQLAQEDSAACRWLLHHRYSLQPELDLVSVAHSIALERLHSQRLKLNQDFSFSSEGHLQAIDSIKASLMKEISAGDRLLLEEILGISK